MKAFNALFYILKILISTLFGLVIFVVAFAVEMFFGDAAKDDKEEKDDIDIPIYDYVEQDGKLVWVDRKAFYR